MQHRYKRAPVLRIRCLQINLMYKYGKGDVLCTAICKIAILLQYNWNIPHCMELLQSYYVNNGSDLPSLNSVYMNNRLVDK